MKTDDVPPWDGGVAPSMTDLIPALSALTIRVSSAYEQNEMETPRVEPNFLRRELEALRTRIAAAEAENDAKFRAGKRRNYRHYPALLHEENQLTRALGERSRLRYTWNTWIYDRY